MQSFIHSALAGCFDCISCHTELFSSPGSGLPLYKHRDLVWSVLFFCLSFPASIVNGVKGETLSENKLVGDLWVAKISGLGFWAAGIWRNSRSAQEHRLQSSQRRDGSLFQIFMTSGRSLTGVYTQWHLYLVHLYTHANNLPLGYQVIHFPFI